MGRIDEIMGGMTLEEKIGQMVIARAYDFWDKIEGMLSKGEIGSLGHVLFTKKHSRDLKETVKNVNHFRAIAKYPLLLYIDAESGITENFEFGTSFPAMMALGATFSPELAYEMGNAIGTESAAIGFNLISSPAVDINTKASNPIIGIRSISDNTELVIELAESFIKGMMEAGIIVQCKHFPGHGDTGEDSHVVLPVISHDKEFLMERELKPYRVLAEKGMNGVMTSHILYPALSGEEEAHLPATLSRNIITGILRNEIGFKGLIISDSLAMKGIKNAFGIERCAVLAVKAGHDLILLDYASDPEIAASALSKAVKAGEIDVSQINDSVERVLKAKEKLGLLDNKPIDPEEAIKSIGIEKHRFIARKISEKSITVLESAAIPFKAARDEKILVVATRGAEEGTGAEDLHELIVDNSKYLISQCRKYSSRCELYVVNEDPDAEEVKDLIKRASDFDTIVFGSFIRVVSYKEGSGSIPDSQVELIKKLDGLGKKFVFLIFGNPYVMGRFDSLKNCICAYSDCIFSVEAAVKVVFGETGASGRLPVTVNEKYKYGYGIETNSLV